MLKLFLHFQDHKLQEVNILDIQKTLIDQDIQNDSLYNFITRGLLQITDSTSIINLGIMKLGGWLLTSKPASQSWRPTNQVIVLAWLSRLLNQDMCRGQSQISEHLHYNGSKILVTGGNHSHLVRDRLKITAVIWKDTALGKIWVIRALRNNMVHLEEETSDLEIDKNMVLYLLLLACQIFMHDLLEAWWANIQVGKTPVNLEHFSQALSTKTQQADLVIS